MAPSLPRNLFRHIRSFVPLSCLAMIPLGFALFVGEGLVTTSVHAAPLNQSCTLVVPAKPLTAQGLATAYQLKATDPAQGPCHEATAGQAAFVQGAVLDPATGAISIYNPLVIDAGTQPAIAPVVPHLPAHAVVGLWFGFNGSTLTLSSATLSQDHCQGGVHGSFGQFAYCNAPAFFAAANQAIAAGTLQIPDLGLAKDGQPCPTVRDFSVVDMDQSDNVTTAYLVSDNGQIAQFSAANAKALQGAQTQVNASDNRLLDVTLDSALGCTPWMAPDLADPGQSVPALPLNELQAAAFQAQPMALVPAGDPMVLVQGHTDLKQLNAYRQGVDQPRVNDVKEADTAAYCTNLLNTAPARLALDAKLTKASSSPDPTVAKTLYAFLAQRLSTTLDTQGLNCLTLLKQANPVQLASDQGVVTDATITVPAPLTSARVNTGNTAANGNPPVGATLPTAMAGTQATSLTTATASCHVNGMTVTDCLGTFSANGQICAVVNTGTVLCPTGTLTLPNEAAGNQGNPAQGANQSAMAICTANGVVIPNCQGTANGITCQTSGQGSQVMTVCGPTGQKQPGTAPSPQAQPQAFASSSDAVTLPSSGGESTVSANLFPFGQCTYWANQRFHDLKGRFVPWTRNANAWQWKDRARAFGWQVNQVPLIGDIIDLQPGVQGASGLGHVGVVEQILSNGHVLTSNMNWAGNGSHIVSVEFAPGPGVSFLHFPQL